MALLKKNILLLIICFIFSNCASVEKYNQQISKLHHPTELKEDVDYAYKKLQKLHPDLYLYISKDSLDYKFNNLKNNLKIPLSSKDFYTKMAVVISSIKQGHTMAFAPFKKMSKKEIKNKGKKASPFRPLQLRKINDKIIVTKNFNKKSNISIGSELFMVENDTVDNLLTSFKNLTTGDGYNSTHTPENIRKNFGLYYLMTHQFKDSLNVFFKKNDSIYSEYLYAFPKKNKKEKGNKKETALKKLSKTDKKTTKKKRKIRAKWEKKYGYNKYTKENVRNFNFLIADSIPAISYMKINGFHNGNYKAFYDECFAKIDSIKSNHLIIDLRDNGGGRLKEIAYLYSYLVDHNFVFIKRSKMTKGSSFLYPFTHTKSILQKSLTTLFYPVLKAIQIAKVKKIDDEYYFSHKNSKVQQPILKNNYSGKIYVLINGYSFSASSILANNLQANKRAFFVGNETGGAYNSTVAGIFIPLELPNSKVKVNFGVMNIKTLNTKNPDGYGIIPDQYVKKTTLKTDEQLNWIINDIKSKITD